MSGLLAGGFNDLDWSPDGQFVLIHRTGDMPYIKRAWQSTEALIDFRRDFVREKQIECGITPQDLWWTLDLDNCRYG